MKLYELTYLLSPELSQEERQELLENITGLLREKGAVLEGSLPSVLKKLGYPIKVIKDFSSRKKEKKERGYLTSIDFRVDKGKAKEIQEKISGLKGIIRFMLFSKKERQDLTKKKISSFTPSRTLKEKPEKKVELKEIEKKLEEILGE